MDKKEFSQIRHFLGKTQEELAHLLCVSPRAVQSFEQGWRTVPANAERQLLFLLSLQRSRDESSRPCWEARNCPPEWKQECTAWEFKAGYFCWFINGTSCQGEHQGNWENKAALCRKCEMFQKLMPGQA